MTPSVDSHCEQERADEEQAMVSGEAQVTNWLCPYCEQVVCDSRHEYDCAACLRAELAAATVRAERAERWSRRWKADCIGWRRGMLNVARRFGLTMKQYGERRRTERERRQASQQEEAGR